MHHVPIVTVLVIGGFARAATAYTINVPGDAPTIQAGIDLAVNGDEGVVADGIHTGAGNVDLSFNGKFITVRSASGDPTLCIIDCEDSSLGFLFTSGEFNSAMLDGFTLTSGTGFFGGGGAIGIGFNSEPTINNCIFDNNNVTAVGGAVDILNSNPPFTNCTFRNNSAAHNGGAVHANGGSPSFTDCTFEDNSAGEGAGMFNEDCSPTLTNCRFSRNAATINGGNAGGMANLRSSPTVTNYTLSGNTTATSVGGHLNRHPDTAH